MSTLPRLSDDKVCVDNNTAVLSHGQYYCVGRLALVDESET